MHRRRICPRLQILARVADRSAATLISVIKGNAERSIASNILAKDFLPHLFYINHGSDAVAHSVWIDCFKALWLSFSSAQKEAISHALNYFLQNGSHTALRDCGKHVIKTLVDAVRGLEQPVAIASTYQRWFNGHERKEDE
uniref:Uncharacterized protein n=1 Tax=Trichuris muris TaxID=70415 RepID=A0A5S6QCG7_TRIMR